MRYRYAFILGRIPELSILEIEALFESQKIPVSSLSYTPSALIATTEHALDCTSIIDRLGGTTKIGEVLIQETVSPSSDEFADVLSGLIREQSEECDKRFTYGISSYSQSAAPRLYFRQIERLGLSIKKVLRQNGRSPRFVMPKRGEAALSSVVVEKQGLLADCGIELLVLSDGDETFIAKTVAVQPFEEFSLRDWQRPEKSMDVGMLPPKIARMMVNLAGISETHTLLDPFCGLGTILSESLLLGYTRVYGGDISAKNVKATRKNLLWIAKEENRPLRDVHVAVQDAKSLSTFFAEGALDAIVTEPYLGPVIKRSGPKNLDAIKKELIGLYSAFLAQAHHVLKRSGRVVIVFPVWVLDARRVFLPVEKILPKGFAPFPSLLVPDFGNRTDRGSIVIARESQHVLRELFVFEKQ